MSYFIANGFDSFAMFSGGAGMSIFLTEASAGGFNTQSILMLVVYVVVIGAIFYFMMRPQRKEQNRIKSMLDALEVGDSVLTTSGFYGVVIDITDDTVIVEFGNNKNCRIPMQKSAITQAEKPSAE